MTATELIELLEIKATNHDAREVITLDANDRPLKVTGIDSYEDVLVLVTEPVR